MCRPNQDSGDSFRPRYTANRVSDLCRHRRNLGRDGLTHILGAGLPANVGVRGSRPAITLKMASSTARAASFSLRCSNIMAPDQICATGLAMPFPAMSGAEPWTGSNIEGNSRSGFILAEGASPIDPTTAAPRSERMSPKRFDPTTTSNQSGWLTKCAVKISMWYWSVLTNGYFFEIAEKRSSQKGMVKTMPLDLVAEVTWLLRV